MPQWIPGHAAIEGQWHTMRSRLLVTTVALTLLLPACASKIRSIRSDTAIVDPAMGFAVLASHLPAENIGEDLGDATAQCVTAALAGIPNARVIPAEQVQRSLLPPPPSEHLPWTLESLRTLVRDDAFRQRAADLRIGYVVIVGGRTDQSLQEKTSPSPFILLWQRESILWAEVVDVAHGESAALVEAKVSGRPVFVFPIGAPAFTETWACHKLKREVIEAITVRESRKP